MKTIRIGNDIRIEWPVELPDEIKSFDELSLTVEVRPSGMFRDLVNRMPMRREETHTLVLNGGAGQVPPRRRPWDAFIPMAGRPRAVHTDDGCGRTPRWDDGSGKEAPPMPARPPHDVCVELQPPGRGIGRPCAPEVLPPVILSHYIEDGKVIAIWTADQQFATGDYDILLYADKDDAGQGVVDQCRFVRLVAHSSQADDCCCNGVQAVIALQPVTLSLSGLSAYEIAVAHGFKGTVEEWLEWLRQPAKEAAEDLKKMLDEWLENLKSEVLDKELGDIIQQSINNYFGGEAGQERLEEIINNVLDGVIGEYVQEIQTALLNNERVVANALARHEMAITEIQNQIGTN